MGIYIIKFSRIDSIKKQDSAEAIPVDDEPDDDGDWPECNHGEENSNKEYGVVAERPKANR